MLDVVVANVGQKGDVGRFSVRWSIGPAGFDPVFDEEVELAGLAEGTDAHLTWEGDFDAVGGIVVLQLDWNNQIDESNESNNVWIGFC